MSERTEALILANKILDRPNADPDDDLAILARQLIRKTETVERLQQQLMEREDGTLDLIHANRDTILRIHEEGIQRIKKQANYLCVSLSQSARIHQKPDNVLDLLASAQLIVEIIQAVNVFHPMHGENFTWPDGS